MGLKTVVKDSNNKRNPYPLPGIKTQFLGCAEGNLCHCSDKIPWIGTRNRQNKVQIILLTHFEAGE